MKKNLIFAQSVLALGGSVFAWFTWVKEYMEYCPSCGQTGSSPFASSCFYGAIIFSLILVLNAIILYIESKEQ